MRKQLLAVGLVGLVVAATVSGCSKKSDPSPPPPPSAGPCGMKPTDWCPSPPGDPCGKHKDVASCRADKNCKGMPYRGESVVACTDDGTGFAKNCPTVGCISR